MGYKHLKRRHHYAGASLSIVKTAKQAVGELLETRLMLWASPVIDALGTASSSPREIVDAGGSAYFSTITPKALWKTNGLPGGTTLVRDFGSNGPSNLKAGPGGPLYFTLSDASGTELWKSDGTAAGTSMVADIRTGSGSSSPQSLTAVGGTLFFTADDGVHGRELWRTDGSAVGTGLVKDINPDSATSSPLGFIAIGSTLYFYATDANYGTELWKTDGTEAGTVMVCDLAPGTASSSPLPSAAFNGLLYFGATDGALGRELYVTDGTAAGTSLVKDLAPGATGSDPRNFKTYNGKLYFTAGDVAGERELYCTDGTAGGTRIVVDLRPGAGGSGAFPMGVVNNRLLISADDGGGSQLWRTDGTAAGTTKLPAMSPQSLIVIGNQAMLTANDPLPGRELFVTDATASGTGRIVDIYPGITSSSVQAMANVGGKLLFCANDGRAGEELWTSDGTAEGTALMKDINTTVDNVQSGPMVAFKGALCFAGSARGLFRTDGTAAGTVLITATKPSTLLAAGDNLFFTVGDVTSTPQLWKTDGTPAGTGMLKQFTFDPPYAGSVSLVGGIGSTVYFDSPLDGDLWKSDGTVAGTASVATIAGGFSAPTVALTIGGSVFISQSTRLIKTDGTPSGTSVVRSGITVGSVKPAADLENLNGVLVFAVRQGDYTADLWRSDGTSAGTFKLRDSATEGFVTVDKPNMATTLATVGDAVYFLSNFALWKTDANATTTIKVRDIGPKGDAYPPYGLTRVGSQLVFVDRHASSQGEYDLWVSDGTEAGTRIFKRLFVNSTFSAPAVGNLLDASGTAYFAGWDLTDGKGVELWCTDGTDAGTFRVEDFKTGSAASTPASFTMVDGTVYFTASGSTASGLWRTPLPVVPPAPSGLVASPESAVRVNLMWTQASGAASGFHIQRSTSSTFATIEQQWTISAESGSFADPVAAPSTHYFYRVQAFSPAGASAWTATPVDTPAPLIPLGPAKIDPSSAYLGVGTVAVGFRHQFYYTCAATIGWSLWRTDGSALYPLLTATPTPVVLGDWMYYTDYKSNQGELWRTDGTPETRSVVKLIPGPIKYLTSYNGKLWFSDAASGGQLWSSDGTEAGTAVVPVGTDTRIEALRAIITSGKAPGPMVGNWMYYTASTPTNYTQVFKTDGTTTVQLTDVLPLNPSYRFDPSGLTAANGYVYFFAAPLPIEARLGTGALWRTDGTPEGTVQLADVGGRPTSIASANGHIFFSVGGNFWTSEGTAAGTTVLKTLPTYNSPVLSDPVALGGRVYFAARGYVDSIWNGDLWSSDGTAEGTVKVEFAGAVNAQHDSPLGLAAVDETLFFITHESDNRYYVWRYRPASSPVPKPAAPTGLNSAVFSAGEILLTWADAAANEESYVVERSRTADFAAIDRSVMLLPNTMHFLDTGLMAGTTYYYRVMASNSGGRSDPAIVGPVATPTSPAPPTGLVATNALPGERVSLQWTDNATDETGYLVQRSTSADFYPRNTITLNAALPADATSYDDNSVTRLTRYWYRVVATGATGYSASAVADIATPESRPLAPSQLQAIPVSSTEIDLMWKDNAVNEYPANGYQIERAGSDGDFTVVASLPANSISYSDMGVVLGAQYTYRLRARNGVGASDAVLSIPARTLAPSLATSVMQLPPLPAAPHPDWMTTIGSDVYFVSSSLSLPPSNGDSGGPELWKTDGTAAGTVRLATGNIRELVAVGSTLYFISGTQLWKTSGTTATTQMIRDYASGPIAGCLQMLAPLGSTLFFTCQSRLWKSDGTAAGTIPVGTSEAGDFIVDLGTILSSARDHYAVSGNYLYFFDGDNLGQPHRGYLWRTDGTTAGTIKISGIRQLQSIVDVQGKLFANGVPMSGSASSLFVIDHAAASATAIATRWASHMTPVGSELYFSSDDGGWTSQVWKSDGTGAGTALVYQLADGSVPYSGRAYMFAQAAGAAYFITSDVYNVTPMTPGTLYRTDGTPAGTFRIRNVDTKEEDAWYPKPLFMTEVDGKLVYSDGDFLWRSDGTTQGTIQIDHIGKAADGTRSSACFGGPAIAVSGDRIFFSGAVAGGGRDLRVASLHTPQQPARLDLAPIAPGPLPDGGTGGADGVLLTWADRSSNETGFVIERSLRSDFKTTDQTAFVPTNTTSYADTSAMSGMTYFYRISAVNAAGESTWSNSITSGAPRVAGTEFDYAPAAHRLVIRFIGNVSASIAPGDFLLANTTTGQVIAPTLFAVAYDADTNSATVTFAGLAGGRLVDGNYHLFIGAGDVANASGVTMEADCLFDFFFLNADANRDRVVNFTDLVAVAQHYNQSGQTWATGDFDGNGLVGFADLVAVAQHYNQSLPAPGAIVDSAAEMLPRAETGVDAGSSQVMSASRASPSTVEPACSNANQPTTVSSAPTPLATTVVPPTIIPSTPPSSPAVASSSPVRFIRKTATSFTERARRRAHRIAPISHQPAAPQSAESPSPALARAPLAMTTLFAITRIRRDDDLWT